MSGISEPALLDKYRIVNIRYLLILLNYHIYFANQSKDFNDPFSPLYRARMFQIRACSDSIQEIDHPGINICRIIIAGRRY